MTDDRLLLRWKFWRAPPAVLSCVSSFVIGLSDEHGDEALVVDLCPRCLVNGELELACERQGARWRVSVDPLALPWSLVEFAIDSPDARAFDVLSVRTGLVVVVAPSIKKEAPLLLSYRDFHFGLLKTVTIEEDFGATMGTHVWNASICLARHLVSSKVNISSERILEVGAGCGLLSLVAAKLGALSVVATDRDHPEAMEILKRNCHDKNIRVASLDFGARPSDDIRHTKPALLLAADVLYAPTAPKNLVTTLAYLPTIKEIIIAHTERDNSPGHFPELARRLEALGFTTACSQSRKIATYRHSVTIYHIIRSSSEERTISL